MQKAESRSRMQNEEGRVKTSFWFLHSAFLNLHSSFTRRLAHEMLFRPSFS
jgi:hypothetical protein